MRKRILGLLLMVVFVFSLSACTTSENSRNDAAGQTEAEQSGQNDSAKTAVVFFSATGTTAEAANLIAEQTDADLFEIVSQETYTSEDLNYTDDNCRANREMDNAAARPAIENDLSKVAEYEVIYLGYPIWHGTAPRIIQTFLENYDLSNATIYTFCTSGGSGIEQSIQDLKSSYPDINIADGKRLNDATAADIREWIETRQSGSTYESNEPML